MKFQRNLLDSGQVLPPTCLARATFSLLPFGMICFWDPIWRGVWGFARPAQARAVHSPHPTPQPQRARGLHGVGQSRAPHRPIRPKHCVDWRGSIPATLQPLATAVSSIAASLHLNRRLERVRGPPLTSPLPLPLVGPSWVARMCACTPAAASVPTKKRVPIFVLQAR